VIVRYRPAHCCSNVASRAHVRLMTKLRNQSELTQTADFGGENGGGSAGVARIAARDTFGSARSR
jgi:hypothetical protein